MANIKSAEKRVRQTETRTARNKAIKTRVKNARKAVLAALQGGDLKLVVAKYNEFAAAADKAANARVLHKNTASRLKSRLSKALKPAAK